MNLRILSSCLIGVFTGMLPLSSMAEAPLAPGVAVPDTVETSIGTLHLNDGYPDDATTKLVYDNLDASRALQAYLLALPNPSFSSLGFVE